MDTDVLWVLAALLAILILIAIALFFREKINSAFRKRDLKNVKEIVEFKKARDVKQATEIRATFRDGQLTTGRTNKMTNAEKNRSFLTIDKVLSERDKSSMMMSFTADHHLKLDTIGAIDEEDPQKYNFDMEKDMPGTYLNTSAKNSTKNSTRKEFFVEFRDRKKGLTSSSAAKPYKDLKIEERAEIEESNHDGSSAHVSGSNGNLKFDTDDGNQNGSPPEEKVEYRDFEDDETGDQSKTPPIAARGAIRNGD